MIRAAAARWVGGAGACRARRWRPGGAAAGGERLACELGRHRGLRALPNGPPGRPICHAVQSFRSPAGGSGLGSVVLGVAEFGDGVGERGEAGDQRDLREVAVVAGERGGGQQPGGPAQAAASRSGSGDPPVGGAGCAVVRAGGLADHPAAQRRSGSMQGVAGGPCGVCCCGRVTGGGEGQDLPGRVGGGAGGVLPDRGSFLGRELAARNCAGVGWAGCPALAELGQRQVGGQLPAAVPDRLARSRRVLGQGDGVPGDLARVAGAVAHADLHAGPLQAGEEVLLAGRGRGCGADLALEGDAGRLLPAAAPGLLGLRPGRARGGGAVAGGGAPQAEAVLDGEARLAHPVVVVRQARAPAVLAGQGSDDMNVVVAVPDGDPADRVVFLPVGCQAGAVHDFARHLSPLFVAEHPVAGSGTGHAMPHRPSGSTRSQRGKCLLQQAVQAPEVPPAAWAQRRFELGRVPPSGDDVRVGVLLVPAGPVQVADEASGPLSAEHLSDHGSLFRSSSAAASR